MFIGVYTTPSRPDAKHTNKQRKKKTEKKCIVKFERVCLIFSYARLSCSMAYFGVVDKLLLLKALHTLVFFHLLLHYASASEDSNFLV